MRPSEPASSTCFRTPSLALAMIFSNLARTSGSSFGRVLVDVDVLVLVDVDVGVLVLVLVLVRGAAGVGMGVGVGAIVLGARTGSWGPKSRLLRRERIPIRPSRLCREPREGSA
jgi:hypothetical protein